VFFHYLIAQDQNEWLPRFFAHPIKNRNRINQGKEEFYLPEFLFPYE